MVRNGIVANLWVISISLVDDFGWSSNGTVNDCKWLENISCTFCQVFNYQFNKYFLRLCYIIFTSWNEMCQRMKCKQVSTPSPELLWFAESLDLKSTAGHLTATRLDWSIFISQSRDINYLKYQWMNTYLFRERRHSSGGLMRRALGACHVPFLLT